MVRTIVVLLACACMASPVSAECMAPVAPDPASRPQKPVPPMRSACVDDASKPGCLGWESYRFNDDVKAFNAKVPEFQKAANAYVARLNTYVAAANAFAKCEVEAMR